MKAAEAFGNQLLKLHFVLGAVQSEFDAGSFEQKRASLRLALIALSGVIANTFPNGAELAAPINELAYALEDLDQGRRPALLQAPKARRGRPGTSNSSRLFRALAAALMEFELRTEGSKERAARRAARHLAQLGYTDRGSEITFKQVQEWREEMSAAPVSSVDRGAQRYHYTVRMLTEAFPEDPRAAVSLLLESLPGAVPR